MSLEDIQKQNEEQQGKAEAEKVVTQPDVQQNIKLSVGDAVPQDSQSYNEYLQWKAEKKAIEAQENLLKPIGGMKGFDTAKEIIQKHGTDTLRENINNKLSSKDAAIQASGISDLLTFVEMFKTFNTQERKEEMPTANLPGIGASTPPSNVKENNGESQLPEVSFDGGVSVENIRHPRVKKAVEDMHNMIETLLDKEPLGAGSLHNIAAKANYETLGKLVKIAERGLGDPALANEAKYVWGRLNEQITEKATAAGDPTFKNLYENADDTLFQLNEYDRARTNGKSKGVNYLEQMFPQKFKK